MIVNLDRLGAAEAAKALRHPKCKETESSEETVYLAGGMAMTMPASLREELARDIEGSGPRAELPKCVSTSAAPTVAAAPSPKGTTMETMQCVKLDGRELDEVIRGRDAHLKSLKQDVEFLELAADPDGPAVAAAFANKSPLAEGFTTVNGFRRWLREEARIRQSQARTGRNGW